MPLGKALIEENSYSIVEINNAPSSSLGIRSTSNQ